MDQKLLSEKFKRLKCCVIIPTYNNYKTLQHIIEGVLVYTEDVIVVNDGSTDVTAEVLENFPQIQQINLLQNKGKGNALRQGFKHADSLGYRYAITIDSDGQHFPEDIPVFIEALEVEENKEILLIGARNMTQHGVPKKSSFGNKFSNFWFWVETGIRLQDTQSGFRLYPIFAMKKLKFYTRKFEFEIEAIVKAAWSGIKVKNIPIKIHYELEDRVSHFRPFKDFTRISILNTWFVLVTFLYIKPRNLFRKLKKKGFKRFIMEDLLGSDDSAEKKAFSIALGVLIGLSPLWGFHTVVVIFLALLFNLNKVIAFAFSNVSLPPFIPLILYFSLKLGSWLLGESFVLTVSEIDPSIELVKYLKSYIVGSLVLSVTAAIACGFASYLFLTLFERKKVFDNG
ncbi:MAG: glycosyltransferase [Aequorivita sp.]|nr:glycosyltransferase [Aequorivita sp.]|tara:strand:+ start:33859 stop:35052 length:1194 start_codon:yes stop_codon:yes gene_type:complete